MCQTIGEGCREAVWGEYGTRGVGLAAVLLVPRRRKTHAERNG